MGSAFTATEGPRFAARVIDPDPGDSVAQIDLFRGITGSSNAVVVASSDGNPSFAWREHAVFPEGTEAHYYLRIRMSDNANIWTGPVYVTYVAGGPTTDVGAPGAAATLALSASPNPTLGNVTASFTLPTAVARGQVMVFDAGGRRVRTLLDGPLEAGDHRIAWTGQSDNGTAARRGRLLPAPRDGRAHGHEEDPADPLNERPRREHERGRPAPTPFCFPVARALAVALSERALQPPSRRPARTRPACRRPAPSWNPGARRAR